MQAKRSRFEWGTGLFECLLPAKAWVPHNSTVGGVRVAAAGLPASYVVRRDFLLELQLRLYETEWADFLSFVILAQGAGVFSWFPDAETGGSYNCYLEAPAPGERWAPARAADYPRVLEVTLILRGAGGVPWEPYFE